MGSSSLSSFSSVYKELLEQELISSVQKLNAPTIIKEAMQYSLSAGGKRIRPLLLFATMHSFGKDPKQGILPATALEMIHTYSLIHDDLPSMDNDDLRRGMATNHKVFGEAMAILAGDALLTYSFQLITEMKKRKYSADVLLQVIEILTKASGAEGMVGGQVADMEGEGQKLSIQELEYIHIHKTGKLLEASVLIGASLSEATKEELQQLSSFAYHLGLAFQIRDDILDMEGDESLIGKPVGSDITNEKSTYPALLTMSGAKKELNMHINKAKAILHHLELETHLLEEIADLIKNRNN